MKKYILSFIIASSVILSAFLYAQAATTPTITNETVFTGSKITLKASAEGTAPINFYWYKNGTFVGISETIVFEKIALTDAGTYMVTAKNLVGEANSDPLTIVVITPVSPSNVKITIIKS